MINYWYQVVSSIEEFCRYKSSVDKNYFYYKNIDFTYAFQKSIYFEIYGSKKITKILVNHKKLNNIYLKSYTHRDILSSIDLFKNVNFKFKLNLKYLIKKITSSNILIANVFLYVINKPVNASKADYLFISTHHKFIRYLLPIYEKLDNSTFLICNDIKESVKICEENNYSYVVMYQNSNISMKTNIDIYLLTILYETILSYIKKIKPKSIIIPEGNAPIYEVLNLVAQNRKDIKTICIQHAWATGFVDTGWRNMHFDLYICWGDVFKKALQPFNKSQKFISIGSHILELNYESSEKDSISFFSQSSASGIISPKKHNEFLDFALYVATKYKKTNIIIREHPSAPMGDDLKIKFQDCKNVEFMNPDKFLLSDVLSRSKITISIISSTLFESLLYDAIPIYFNNIEMPRLDIDLVEMNMALEIKSINEEKDKIKAILEGNNDVLEKNKKNKYKFFLSYGTKARNKIVQIIKSESI